MIRQYSRRLLSPFVGVVQIAETPDARAVSLDGRNWEVQYTRISEAQFCVQNPGVDPRLRFFLVATIESGTVKTRGRDPLVMSEPVRAAVDQLYAAVSSVRLPFEAADADEYWLIDAAGGAPLALLQTSIDREERDRLSPRPSWVAMPASQLAVPRAEPTDSSYVPPVNYRLERAVEERAGPRPRATWLQSDRRAATHPQLPPCLVREDWPNEEQRELCARYIKRLAPRLLMLHGLPRDTRRRLEIAASEHAFDVDRFHGVYPEVVDHELLKAARVEARLRRTNAGRRA